MAAGAAPLCVAALGGQSMEVGVVAVAEVPAAITGAAAPATMPTQRAATVKPRVIGFMTIVKLRSIGSRSA
ncbi:hypothetical protein GTS_53600 [Gandjariella thermophila]|uniref:Uncharacterized protein n=1 Tax=Gandjariella thermophila TaxID=1931992 RepID=A0A4D4JIK9_9PSEU|nr:hypothetical protein GTS_53600 [Gandjariella thermophila]